MDGERRGIEAARLEPGVELRELWGVLAGLGGPVPAAVVAAVCDVPTALARRHLWALVRAGAAVEERDEFACAPVAWADQVDRGEPAARSWKRATRWYLATAFAAASVLGCQVLPGGEVIQPDSGRPAAGFDGVPGVLDWYRRTHRVLVETVERAAGSGDDASGWRLVLLDAQIAITAGPHPDVEHWEHVFDLGAQAADRAGEPGAAAMLAEYRGKISLHFGHYDQALAAHTEALASREQADDQIGQMRSHNAIALLLLRTDARAADEHFTRALRLARVVGDELFTALIRANLAAGLCEQGRYAMARETLERAITYLRASGPGYYLANALQTMARAHRLQGAYAFALGFAIQAVEEATAAGLPLYLSGPLVEFAEVMVMDGDRQAVLSAVAEACAIHESYGDTVRAQAIRERIAQAGVRG